MVRISLRILSRFSSKDMFTLNRMLLALGVFILGYQSSNSKCSSLILKFWNFYTGFFFFKGILTLSKTGELDLLTISILPLESSFLAESFIQSCPNRVQKFLDCKLAGAYIQYGLVVAMELLTVLELIYEFRFKLLQYFVSLEFIILP